MITVTSIDMQSEGMHVPLEALEELFELECVIDQCFAIRNANTEAEQKRLKIALPCLMVTGNLFWIDCDGSNHQDGNMIDISFESIAKIVPHLAWFISSSGKGMKILIQINRECASNERGGIYLYLIETISRMTGLKIDPARSDLAFATDQELHISDGIFEVPEVLEKTTIPRLAGKTARYTGPVSKNLFRLKEILALCENTMTYNRWFAIVMAALKEYGEGAIPLLEFKWESTTPYESLLRYAEHYNSNILETIWRDRIKQCGRKENDPYSRKVFAGATGSGKSECAIDNIQTAIVDRADVGRNYVIFVVSSVEQGIDLGKKLKRRGITFEILVSKQTYFAADHDLKKQLVTESSNKTHVKVIQLAALKGNSFFNHMRSDKWHPNSDKRHLRHVYIDELTITDFIRPSIMTSSFVRGQLEISTDDAMIASYKKNYSNKDLSFAKKLVEERDDSHFISSILFHDVDTTVLTTEELTIACLERLDFKIITLKKKETDVYRDTCTLHMSRSPDYVIEYVKSEEFKLLIEDYKFQGVFANSCEYATGNLITIKGQHLVGKNLSVIRNLPLEFVSMVKDLFFKCFKTTDIDPVALHYKDSLMQAVGRSIGFRKETEAWVMVHSRVWSMISEYDFIYKIQNWNVDVSEELKNKIEENRSNRKQIAKANDERKSVFWAKEKEKKIQNKLAVTDDQKCILTKTDIKKILGAGVTLTEVAAAFNKKVHARPRHIKGVEQVL